MKYFSVLLLSIFVLLSCSTEKNAPLPTVESTTVRLKHLLTTREVVGNIGSYTEGWDVNELNVTNIGSYPNFPYVYYYTLSMKKDVPGSTPETRSISAQAGGSVDADVTLEQFLAENGGYVAINHQQLANYPNTYIVKNSENDNEEWMIDLFTPHIGKKGNKTMHSIRLYGLSTPPPTDEAAVTALLSLVEKHH